MNGTMNRLLETPWAQLVGKLLCVAATSALTVTDPHSPWFKVELAVNGACALLGWNVPAGPSSSLPLPEQSVSLPLRK